VLRQTGVAGSVTFVGFIVLVFILILILTLLRYFSIRLVNENPEEVTTMKTATTHMKSMPDRKWYHIFSAKLETVWAIGVSIVAGHLSI
jgi:hypothetical protein